MKKLLFVFLCIIILIIIPNYSYAKDSCFFAGADIDDVASKGHVTQEQCNQITAVAVISTITVGSIAVLAITGDPFAPDASFAFTPTYKTNNNELGFKYSLKW